MKMPLNSIVLRCQKTYTVVQRAFYCGIIPFVRAFRQNSASLWASARYFLNTPHFPTVVIAVSLVATIFANVLIPEQPDNTDHTVREILSGPEKLLSVSAVTIPPEPRELHTTTISGIIRPGDTLTTSFRRHRISDAVRLDIIRAFTGHLDFKDLRPYDHYTVTLDAQGRLVKCVYEAGPLDIHEVSRKGEGDFVAERVAIPLERRTLKVSGTVNSSLFAAFLPSGEKPKLLYAFADIFASQVDFNTETRKGDRFSMVFEKYYKNDAFIGYGKILVARYERANGEVVEGFYYAPDDARIGSYFDGKGRELGASFIRSPVPMARISSKFTYRRFHPILKIVRPHLGVDLAAPRGTPVMAAADGRIRFIGRNGGFGKQIVLEHKGGFQTYYGHLAGYKRGLHKGSRVQQKQIIGYVGSTGLATGPHLDYRLRHNGTFQNPFALKFKPRSVLKKQQLARFRQRVEILTALADSFDGPKVMQVQNIIFTPGSKISLL